MLEVSIVTPQKMLFQGKAESVIFTGEAGAFEVLSFHRPLLSRLLPGPIVVDQRVFAIRRGVVKVLNDVVTVLVEAA